MIKSILLALLSFIFSVATSATENMVSIESRYSVKETANRFESILNNKGITFFPGLITKKMPQL